MTGAKFAEERRLRLGTFLIPTFMATTSLRRVCPLVLELVHVCDRVRILRRAARDDEPGVPAERDPAIPRAQCVDPRLYVRSPSIAHH
jgi:hypothetical protein